MKNWFPILCLGLWLITTSCKTYRPVDVISPKTPKDERSKAFIPSQLNKLNMGDSLRIETHDAESLYLIYHSVQNDSIKGLLWKKNGEKISSKKYSTSWQDRVAISQIREIQVRKFDRWATVGLIAGLSPVVGLLLILLAWAISPPDFS